MHEPSIFRLYLLRATYLLIFLAVGFGMQALPGVFHPPKDLENMRSVVRAVLACVALLAILGIRYPLRMLPLLFFELTWKLIWLVAFWLPLWQAHRLGPDTAETFKACAIGVVLFAVVIPWPFVFRHYIKSSGDPWKRSR